MIRKIGFISFLAGLALPVAAPADSETEILERIKPIGTVILDQPAALPAPAAAPAAPAAAAAPAPAAAPAEKPAAEAAPAVVAAGGGEKTYNTFCMACHMTGAANAPKLGDKAAWAPRIAKGMDALVQSSINGVAGTAMPPRGTCATCSDDDLKAAVEYMVSKSQ